MVNKSSINKSTAIRWRRHKGEALDSVITELENSRNITKYYENAQRIHPRNTESGPKLSICARGCCNCPELSNVRVTRRTFTGSECPAILIFWIFVALWQIRMKNKWSNPLMTDKWYKVYSGLGQRQIMSPGQKGWFDLWLYGRPPQGRNQTFSNLEVTSFFHKNRLSNVRRDRFQFTQSYSYRVLWTR